ncbi:MAG TPA: TadE/TadG family type IV pilus assembly protein [Rhizomicrobium sp.]
MRRIGSTFLRRQDGTVAVEFAFIAPILITMFFGTVEVCNAVICREKVTTLAASAADLVAQDAVITESQITDVFSALNAVIYPYPSSSARIIITSVKADPNHAGQYIVDWSRAQNTTAHTQGANITVPAGLVTTGGSVILAEVTYSYSSSTSNVIHAPITFHDSFYARPRQSTSVTIS